MESVVAEEQKFHKARARRVGPGRLSALSLLVWEGSYANIFIVLTGGAFLTGLALMFGASDLELGLLAAAPFLLQSAQLLSPIFFPARENQKRRFTLVFVLSRLIWLALIPLMFVSQTWRLHVLLLVVAVSSLMAMAATPAWLAYMAAIVPARIRGRFFSRRNAALAAITLAATIVGSIILDWSRSANAEAYGFLIVILLATVGAVMAWRAMARIPNAVKRDEANHGFGGWSDLMAPLKDRAFRRILIVFAAWNAAIGSSAAFFAPHMLLNLNMSFFQIGVYSSTHALVTVLSSRYWGRLIDRFGSRVVLNICAIGIGLIPLVWLYPRAGLLWILIPEVIYSGALWAGFNLAAFTLPLDRSPERDRTVYLSVFAAVTGAAFFAASVLAGWLAETLADWLFTFEDRVFLNYHVLFLLSVILRLATAGIIMAFREPSETRLPVVIQLMGYAVLKRFSVGRQIFPFAAEAVDKNETVDTK